MRIIHVVPPPFIGGVEDVVNNIAEHMASRGHEVYVVTYNRLKTSGIGSLPREEVINGVKVIRLKPTVTWSHGSYSPELPYLDEDKIEDLLSITRRACTAYTVYISNYLNNLV